MSKALKIKTEGNCLPVMLAKYNLIWYVNNISNEQVKKEYTDCAKMCDNVMYDIIKLLPVYYRDSSYKRVNSIAKRIYFDYMAKEQYDTGKVFMVIHNWIYSLVEEGLIDEPDERFISLINQLDDQIAKGFNGEFENIDPEDVEKRYLSARKQVKKIHEIAINEGLYKYE